MNITQLKIKKNGWYSLGMFSSGSHYKFLMSLGRLLPSSKCQAKYFIQKKILLGTLTGDDVELVESVLTRHGFVGDYKLTKSKQWARLQNDNDLYEALKLEYNL